MARNKATDGMEPQEPEQDPKTTTKVYQSRLRKAKTVASYRGMDLFDYLDSVIGPAIDRDFAAMFDDEAKSRRKPPPSARP